MDNKSSENSEERKHLCEQVAAILAADGVVVDAEVMAYMQILLDGGHDYAGHRDLLEKLLKEVTP